MRHILVESDVLGSRLSFPKTTLVSQGYVVYESIKVYVQVYWYPVRGMYKVRVKLPKHKTLHLIWGEADFNFENNEWLTFWNSVTGNGWRHDEQLITRTFDYIWFTD